MWRKSSPWAYGRWSANSSPRPRLRRQAIGPVLAGERLLGDHMQVLQLLEEIIFESEGHRGTRASGATRSGRASAAPATMASVLTSSPCPSKFRSIRCRSAGRATARTSSTERRPGRALARESSRRARSPAPRAGWRRSARIASPAASHTASSGCVASVRRIA